MLQCFNLPESTIEECIDKSTALDSVYDAESAHRIESKALHMFVRYVHECYPNDSIAARFNTYLKSPRGPRWYA